MSWISRPLLLLLLGLSFTTPAMADSRPNILWISCEDISPHLGCYGHAEATTPNLDQLAQQGVRYTNASTVTGVCATCRASIITGMYPSTLGNQFMRCSVDLPDHVQLFPKYLRDAGYYCTNNSKTDYNVTGQHNRCWDESSRKAHWRDRPRKDQPFFAVFNFTTTHESRVFKYERPPTLSDSELHDPAKMQLPPYYPDTPITRRDWAHYFDKITAMDKQVGELLGQLEADGLADRTIVIYWSDHGVGLPRAKRWIYQSGTHVPLIVRIPEKFRRPDQALPGSVSSELVSLMDLGPTTMNLVGLGRPDYMHGRAFLGEDRSEPREYLFTIRDRMDERYDLIRAVRDEQYKYIRNFQSFKPYFQIINYMEQEHTMQELRRLHRQGDLTEVAAQFMADQKPLEELYDLHVDPHEVENLIDQVDTRPELREALNRLTQQQRQWMFETRDTGLIPEADMARRAKRLGTRYAILRQGEGPALLERLLDVNVKVCAQNDLAGLIEAYDDEDPAVRYWAVTGIGNHKQNSPEVMKVVRSALQDSADTVRVAAARAAWQLGHADLAIAVLRETAKTNEEFLSLLAMHVIDEMDEHRDEFEDVIRWVKEEGEKYPARVATYLLSSS